VPYLGSNTNAEFGNGLSHVVNPGRSNENSIVLDGGLQQTGDRWNAMTPHGVLNTALGASSQDDSSWQQLQREQGGYQPGSMTTMQDQLDQGSDNLP
jgi:hypothetical protein